MSFIFHNRDIMCDLTNNKAIKYDTRINDGRSEIMVVRTLSLA